MLTLQSVAQRIYNALQGNLQVSGDIADELGRKIVATLQGALGNYKLTFNLIRREHLWGFIEKIDLSINDEIRFILRIYWAFSYDEEGFREFENNVQRLRIFLEELQDFPPLLQIPDKYIQNFLWIFEGYAKQEDWWGGVEIYANKEWTICNNGEVIVMEKGNIKLKLIGGEVGLLYLTSDPNIGMLPTGDFKKNIQLLEGMQYWKKVRYYSRIPYNMQRIWVGEWDDVIMTGKLYTSAEMEHKWLSGVYINSSKKCLELKRVAGIKIEGMNSITYPRQDQLINCAVIVFVLARMLNKKMKSSKGARQWVRQVTVQQDRVIIERDRGRKRWEIPFELADDYGRLKQYIEQNILLDLLGRGGWQKAVKALHKYGDVLTQEVEQGNGWVYYKIKMPKTIIETLNGLASMYPDNIKYLGQNEKIPVYVVYIPPQYRDEVEYDSYVVFGDKEGIYALAFENPIWRGYIKWCIADRRRVNIPNLASLEEKGKAEVYLFALPVKGLEGEGIEDDIEVSIICTIVNYIYKIIEELATQGYFWIAGEIELPYGEVQKKSDGIYMKIIPQQQSFLLLSWDEIREWYSDITKELSEVAMMPHTLEEKMKNRIEKALKKDRKKILKQYLEHIGALDNYYLEKNLKRYYSILKMLLEEGERIHFSGREGEMYCELWKGRILIWHDTDYNNNWVSLIKEIEEGRGAPRSWHYDAETSWKYDGYYKTFIITALKNPRFDGKAITIEGLQAQNIPQVQEARKYIQYIKSLVSRIQSGEYILFLKEEKERDELLEEACFRVSHIEVSPPVINFTILTSGRATDVLTFNTATQEVFVNGRKLSEEDEEQSRKVVLQSVKNIMYKCFTEEHPQEKTWDSIYAALDTVLRDMRVDAIIEDVLRKILEDYLQGKLTAGRLKQIFARITLVAMRVEGVSDTGIIDKLKDLGRRVVDVALNRWLQGEELIWDFWDMYIAFEKVGIVKQKEIRQKIIEGFDEIIEKYMRGEVEKDKMARILEITEVPQPLALYTSPITGKQYLIVNMDDTIEITPIESD